MLFKKYEDVHSIHGINEKFQIKFSNTNNKPPIYDQLNTLLVITYINQHILHNLQFMVSETTLRLNKVTHTTDPTYHI